MIGKWPDAYNNTTIMVKDQGRGDWYQVKFEVQQVCLKNFNYTVLLSFLYYRDL